MARYHVNTKFSLCNVHIADGFADDCDELIHRCSQVKTLSYEKFCVVWKEMNFACVFYGRTSASELAELTEEMLYIAKHYMVANTDNYEESVAGLFLVYGLLNLQPISKFAFLRLIPDDVPAIEKIKSVARQTRRLDVLYILGSVLINNTHYNAVERERGMESTIRKYLEGYTTIDRQGVRAKGVFYRQNEELDILRELDRLGQYYKRAKSAVVGPGKSERNLNYVNDNMASAMNDSLKKLISGLIDDGSSEFASSEGEPSSVQAIKDRAMKMPVKGIAHLLGVADVIPQGRKRKPQKIPRRKGQPRRGPKRRKKRNSKDSDSESTSEEDDLVVFDLDDDEDDEESDEDEDEELQRSPQGNDCEIEFIDEYRNKEQIPLTSMLFNQTHLPDLEASEGDSENLSEITDALQKRNVILTKLGSSSQCASLTPDYSDVAELTEVTEMTSDDIFKKPMKLPVREKRDLKKAWIKTKFKRMGILPIANFQDSEDDKDVTRQVTGSSDK